MIEAPRHTPASAAALALILAFVAFVIFGQVEAGFGFTAALLCCTAGAALLAYLDARLKWSAWAKQRHK